MIDIKNPADCCGCNACGDVCVRKAISFERNEEGFLYPVVDRTACTNCGLCERVCPMLRVDEIRKARGDRKASMVAAITKDIAVRFDSTSGGLFSVLAQKVLEEGGFLGGAVWDDAFGIFQVVTDKAEDLPRLRSSKYAQSDARGFFAAVKAAAQTGRPVLVCGTPCQMVAVRTFLGKDYPNVLVVDFICRGINSPLVMRKYIDLYERRHGSKVVAVKQKNKELGWHRLTTKFTFADGSVEYDPRETSPYMRSYILLNASCRHSCYACRFKGFPRLADITLADCWGAVKDLEGAFNLDLGTSLVMCNTDRGQAFFDSVKDRVETSDIDEAKMLDGNKCLTISLPKPTIGRDEFFEKVRTLPFDEAVGPYLAKATMKFSTDPKAESKGLARLWSFGKGMFRVVRRNGLGAVLGGRPLLLEIGNTVIDRRANTTLSVNGTTKFGFTIYRKSSLESRLLLMDGASLELNGGWISYGCDIEVMAGAKMSVGKDFYSNIGFTAICGESITFGEGVTIGRNVTVRDNNGHWVNTTGYRRTKPVVVGDHVWLCEGCQVMPGVKIGSGAIVAAGAIVTEDVPANTLVAGIPARVVKTGVEWRR